MNKNYFAIYINNVIINKWTNVDEKCCFEGIAGRCNNLLFTGIYEINLVDFVESFQTLCTSRLFREGTCHKSAVKSRETLGKH